MSSSCQNCGADGFQKTKGYECKGCGFRIIETKEMPTVQLVYCEGCGCQYLAACPNHDKERQKPVKL